MSTAAQVKSAIDAAITNQTAPSSVSQTAVGTQMKNVTDFANDNFVPLALAADTSIVTNGHKLSVEVSNNAGVIKTVNVQDSGVTIVWQDPNTDQYNSIIIDEGSFSTQISQISTGNSGFLHCTDNDVYMDYIDGATGNKAEFQVDTTGAWQNDAINNKWMFYTRALHASDTPDPREVPDWGFIEGYVDGLFDSGIATLVNGQVTVNSALVKTISRQITLNYNSPSGTLGILAALGADIIDNTSFVIKSLNPDGTVNTADNSQVRYCVIGD